MQKQWNVEVLRCINAWANIGWDANEMIWPMNQWINERMESMNQWVNESLSQQSNEFVNESMTLWINVSMNLCMSELASGWINEALN